MKELLDSMKAEYAELHEIPEEERIHESAHVHPSAKIGEQVVIGPFSYVGENVEIGDRCVLKNHVNMTGHTTIGEENVFFPFCSVGSQPQDLSHRDEECRLEIGNQNVFRESVTLNLGTEKDLGVTRIGSNNYIMAYVHVAHDCVLKDGNIIANGVQFGGHVTIESNVVFGGLAAIHHFATVGKNAFVGGLSRVMWDVPPFMTVAGDPAQTRSVNSEGLRRNGFSEDDIDALKQAHRKIFRTDGTRKEEINALQNQENHCEAVDYLLTFLDRMQQSPQGRAREMDRDF